MKTRWVLKTHDATLETVQLFLGNVFRNANLASMLVPVQTDAPHTLDVQFIADPARLDSANPFAPVMKINSARLVIEWLQAHSQQQLGAILHACEVRALIEVLNVAVGELFILQKDPPALARVQSLLASDVTLNNAGSQWRSASMASKISGHVKGQALIRRYEQGERSFPNACSFA